MSEVLSPALVSPVNFSINEITQDLRFAAPATPAPLGPLVAFTGNWTGSGFNTIFRPNSSKTPTGPFPVPPVGPDDNVLELNLTSETLSFCRVCRTFPTAASARRRTSSSMACPICNPSATSPPFPPRAFTLSREYGSAFRRQPLPRKVQRWRAWDRYPTARPSRRRARSQATPESRPSPWLISLLSTLLPAPKCRPTRFRARPQATKHMATSAELGAFHAGGHDHTGDAVESEYGAGKSDRQSDHHRDRHHQHFHNPCRAALWRRDREHRIPAWRQSASRQRRGS